jgi:multimeric flavodoxin WrbA
MKILALNGSHRGAGGLTQFLLDKLAEGVRQAGGQFTTVVLADRRITPCAACEKCHSPESYLHCVYEEADDVAAIFAEMRAADILIYATPVYVFGLTGRMKTFLDRFNGTAGTGELRVTDSGLFFGTIDEGIYSKPTVVLTLCGNVEPDTIAGVVGYFKTFCRFLDAPLVGVLARKSAGLLEPAKAGDQTAVTPAIAAVLDAYVEAGRQLAAAGRIEPATEKKANRHILPIPFLDLILRFPFLKRLALKRAAKTKEEK